MMVMFYFLFNTANKELCKELYTLIFGQQKAQEEDSVEGDSTNIYTKTVNKN